MQYQSQIFVVFGCCFLVISALSSHEHTHDTYAKLL